MGIEPTQSAWKADVLPLNYTRKLLMTADLHIIQSAVVFVNAFYYGCIMDKLVI
jgi:hypothetical protein